MQTKKLHKLQQVIHFCKALDPANSNVQTFAKFLKPKCVFKKTEKNKTYNLYTIATPADPTEAAYVRMRRFLLCKVVIK